MVSKMFKVLLLALLIRFPLTFYVFQVALTEALAADESEAKQIYEERIKPSPYVRPEDPNGVPDMVLKELARIDGELQKVGKSVEEVLKS
jgi:hypothetical protein